MSTSSPIDKDKALQAVETVAWLHPTKCPTCDGDGEIYDPDGRRTVHTRRGGFGADNDLAGVLDEVRNAKDLEVVEVTDFYRTLIVTSVDGHRFAVDIGRRSVPE